MASAIVERLRDRRQQIAEQMKEIAERASEENRNFTAEEQGKWESLNEEYDQIQARESAALEQQEKAKASDETFERLHGKTSNSREVDKRRGGGREVEQRQTEAGNSELRAWMRGEGPRFYDVVPTGPIQTRDGLLTTGATTGGDLIPEGFYARLVEHLIQTAAIMSTGVTVINTSGGGPIPVPKTTAHSSASIVTEGQAIAESDPTFGQVTLNAYKYGALVQVSRELLDDSGVDLEGYLARETGRALGNAFGAHAVAGDGSSKPRGVLTDATVGHTGGTGDGGAPGYNDVVDTFHSVIAPYRQSRSCYWLLNDSTVGTLRKITATSTGIPIWQPSMQLGAPDLLLGKPMVTDPNMPAVATAAKSLLFGDFSTYFVRLAGAIRFERSDDFAFNSDMVTFRALMRADGALVDLTGSIKAYQGAAT